VTKSLFLVDGAAIDLQQRRFQLSLSLPSLKDPVSKNFNKDSNILRENT
jgi:hypothetical protein